VFAAVEFACDLAKRTGMFRVPGVMSMRLEPIRNPVTGAEHPAQIRLPEGFEFRSAEMASGSFEGTGEIAFRAHGKYGFLSYVAYGPHGVIAAESDPDRRR
jgi:hypothetical protein